MVIALVFWHSPSALTSLGVGLFGGSAGLCQDEGFGSQTRRKIRLKAQCMRIHEHFKRVFQRRMRAKDEFRHSPAAFGAPSIPNALAPNGSFAAKRAYRLHLIPSGRAFLSPVMASLAPMPLGIMKGTSKKPI